MVRELKFRAWDRERGVMVYGQDIEEHEDELDEVSYTYHAPRYQTGLSYGKLFVAYTSKSGDFTECEVMQSTGLCDKDGKEIYEGDIDGTDGELMVVCFEDGRFGLKFPCDDGYFEDCIAWDRCEIIGNVYEHSHICCNPSTKGGETG